MGHALLFHCMPHNHYFFWKWSFSITYCSNSGYRLTAYYLLNFSDWLYYFIKVTHTLWSHWCCSPGRHSFFLAYSHPGMTLVLVGFLPLSLMTSSWKTHTNFQLIALLLSTVPWGINLQMNPIKWRLLWRTSLLGQYLIFALTSGGLLPDVWLLSSLLQTSQPIV